jgi:hypothetical protein
MKKLLIVLFLLPFCVSAQKIGFQEKAAKIDTYVNALLSDWNIPGLALVIVHKDQVIYSKGYGYRIWKTSYLPLKLPCSLSPQTPSFLQRHWPHSLLLKGN